MLTVCGSPARQKRLSSCSSVSSAASASRRRPDTGSTITGAAQRTRSRMRCSCAQSRAELVTCARCGTQLQTNIASKLLLKFLNVTLMYNFMNVDERIR